MLLVGTTVELDVTPSSVKTLENLDGSSALLDD